MLFPDFEASRQEEQIFGQLWQAVAGRQEVKMPCLQDNHKRAPLLCLAWEFLLGTNVGGALSLVLACGVLRQSCGDSSNFITLLELMAVVKHKNLLPLSFLSSGFHSFAHFSVSLFP